MCEGPSAAPWASGAPLVTLGVPGGMYPGSCAPTQCPRGGPPAHYSSHCPHQGDTGAGEGLVPRGSAPLCAGLRAWSQTREGGGPGSTQPCWCRGTGPRVSLVGRPHWAGSLMALWLESPSAQAAFLCACGGLAGAWPRSREAQVSSSVPAQPAASFSPHSAFLGVSHAGAAAAALTGGAGEARAHHAQNQSQLRSVLKGGGGSRSQRSG